MATRFYLQNAAADYTPATLRGGWNISNANASKMGAKAGVAATDVVTKNNTTSPQACLFRRFVSDPIAYAGDLEGTIAWVAGVVESNTLANAFWKLYVYVTQGDSDTPRGSALFNATFAVSGTVGTEFTATATGRGEGTEALTNTVACQVGDRVVVEIGYSATNTNATYSCTLNRGNTGATALAQGSTAVTTNPGWIELSDPNGLWTGPVVHENQHRNPACGANATGYVVENGTNNGRQTVTGFPRTEGIRVTATSTTGVNVRYISGIGQAAPGDVLAVSTYLKTSVTRTVSLIMDWMTDSGYISSSDGPDTSIPAGTATRVSFTTPAAPATTTRWQITLVLNAPASGNTLEVSCSMVDKAGLQAYADGESTDWVWDGTQYSSASHYVAPSGGGPAYQGSHFPFLGHHAAEDAEDGPVPGLWVPSRTLWRPRRTDRPVALAGAV